MKALVTAELSDTGRARLADMGYDVVHAGWGATGTALTPAELVDAAREATLLVVEVEGVDADTFDALPHLQIVATARGNPTNVDLEAAAARDIPVLCAPGRNAASVADYTLGLILTHSRSIARGQRHLRAVGWHVGGELPYLHFRGPELAGRTLGVIGFGAVGRQVAHRAVRGFEMRVLTFDPYGPRPPWPIEHVDALDDLLAASDVVSLHCALTPETVGLIGRRELALMRPHALLVNTARAAAVEEAALVETLRQGAIGGAALDVFWTEPLPRDHPILSFDAVTVTPHLAGAAHDVVAHHSDMILDGLAALQDGRRPRHLANPAVWGG